MRIFLCCVVTVYMRHEPSLGRECPLIVVHYHYHRPFTPNTFVIKALLQQQIHKSHRGEGEHCMYNMNLYIYIHLFIYTYAFSATHCFGASSNSHPLHVCICRGEHKHGTQVFYIYYYLTTMAQK